MKNLGESGVLEHKSGNISETRKARGKVTVEGLQELTNALLNGDIPTPYGLLFPKIGGSLPPPKTSIVIISGTDEATEFKFGWYIHRIHPNKSPIKNFWKRSVGVSRDCPKF